MKTNVLMKIAVVFMAAFGAYAFSGTTQVDLKPYSIENGNNCTNILAKCSEKSDGPICQIMFNGNLTPVLELNCISEIRHDNSNPVEWQ